MKRALTILLALLLAGAAWGAPRTVTVKPSGGDYTNLGTAVSTEAGLYPDITADNGSGSAGILTFEISGDWSGGPDTTVVNTAAFTTSPTYDLRVTVVSASRHPGYYDATKYVLNTGANTAFSIGNENVRLTGLQIYHSDKTVGNRFGINIEDGANVATLLIDKCILRGNADNDWGDAAFVGTNVNSLIVRNSIIYAWGDSGNGRGAVQLNDYTATLQNVTFAANLLGVRALAGTVTLTNCLFSANSTDATGTIADTYCATSNDNTKGLSAGGTGNRFSQTFTFAGAGNYHLDAGDAGALTYGTSLAGTFTDDIDGGTRPTAWAIGADDIPAAGSVVPQLMYYYRQQD